MENVVICLLFLLLLIVSGIISKQIPGLPLPLIQIVIGTITCLFFSPPSIGFNPDVFMLLFIPPLLFNDSCDSIPPNIYRRKHPFSL